MMDMVIAELLVMVAVLIACGAGCIWLYKDIFKQIKQYEEKFGNDNDGDREEEE